MRGMKTCLIDDLSWTKQKSYTVGPGTEPLVKMQIYMPSGEIWVTDYLVPYGAEFMQALELLKEKAND